MRKLMKLVVFFLLLLCGIVYVDYHTNAASGQGKITVLDYAGEQISDFLQKFQEK